MSFLTWTLLQPQPQPSSDLVTSFLLINLMIFIYAWLGSAALLLEQQGSNIVMDFCTIKQSSSWRDEGANHLCLLLVFFMSRCMKHIVKALKGLGRCVCRPVTMAISRLFDLWCVATASKTCATLGLQFWPANYTWAQAKWGTHRHFSDLFFRLTFDRWPVHHGKCGGGRGSGNNTVLAEDDWVPGWRLIPNHKQYSHREMIEAAGMLS